MATKGWILFVGSHSYTLTHIGIFLQFVCNSAQEDCRKPPGRNQHTESTKRNEKRQKSKILQEVLSKKRWKGAQVSKGSTACEEQLR